MSNEGKAMVAALDKISVQSKAIRRARDLIEDFALTDPGLWPVLSEIDLALNHTRQAAEDAAPRITQAALRAAHLITHREPPTE